MPAAVTIAVVNNVNNRYFKLNDGLISFCTIYHLQCLRLTVRIGGKFSTYCLYIMENFPSIVILICKTWKKPC